MTTTSTTARTVTVDTIGLHNLRFESSSCSRCLGSGQMPYAVNNGRCFKCGGSGRQLTAKGRSARKAYDAFRTSQMVPVTDVLAGDRIKIDNVVTGTVLEVLHRPSNGYSTQGEIRTPLPPTVEFRFSCPNYGIKGVQVSENDSVHRPTTASNVALWNRALRLSGAILTLKAD